MARFSSIFITCLAASVSIGDSNGGNAHDWEQPIHDEVTLLQAAAELKKAQKTSAEAVKKPIADKGASYPEYSREDCVPTYSISSPKSVATGDDTDLAIPVETSVLMESVKMVDDTSKTEPVVDATTTDQVPTSTPNSSTSSSWELQIVVVLLAGLCYAFVKSRQDAADQKPAKYKVTDSVQQETWTTLLDAALAANEALFEEAFKKLSEEGMVNIDSWGCTVLHFAAKGGSVPIVNRLLEHGMWVDSEDAWDETPLHIAARSGHMEVCKFLLIAGAGINTLNAEDRTPLVVAGWANHVAVCRFLLAQGAGVGGVPEEELPPMVAEMLALQKAEHEAVDASM